MHDRLEGAVLGAGFIASMWAGTAIQASSHDDQGPRADHAAVDDAPTPDRQPRRWPWLRARSNPYGDALATLRQARRPEAPVAPRAKPHDDRWFDPYPAPPMRAPRVFQGDPSWSPDGATVIAVFDPTNAHARKELPRLEARLTGLPDVKLVALTAAPPAADADVEALIGESDLRLAVARAPDTIDALGAPVVPWAVVVRDGQVVWTGAPSVLQPETPELNAR